MSPSKPRRKKSNFQRFFIRGLGILLPTVLTIWILIAVYMFIEQRIAGPINKGVREIVLATSSWPETDPKYVKLATDPNLDLPATEKAAYENTDKGKRQDWLNRRARRKTLEDEWNQFSLGTWAVLDLIGFVLAVVLIYIAGVIFGGFLGRKLYRRAEEVLKHIPVFKAIYPYVKQVTDYLFGGEDGGMRFDRVVAVEYPRKGIWSIGLVTGATMISIQREAHDECVTVFVPSSPTPFTGYTITVPVTETIELPISIDEALRFTVSGGVILPDGEVEPVESEALPAVDNNEQNQ